MNARSSAVFAPFSERGGTRTAFSLVETLVAVGVIAVMMAVGSVAYQAALASGRKVKEIRAANNLFTAYALAASENDGRFLPGYDRTVNSVNWHDGAVIEGGPIPNRYPYRLAPYFDWRLEGTILTQANARDVKPEETYLVSCYPAFGINYLFVGGDISSQGAVSFPEECITVQGRAASVLVFATAGNGVPENRIGGFCILTPPNEYGPMWSRQKWTPEADPWNYGSVDARHGGKAICAFLDGSVRMHSVEELRDMRLWNRNAAALNDPDYFVPPPLPGGGRGGR